MTRIPRILEREQDNHIVSGTWVHQYGSVRVCISEFPSKKTMSTLELFTHASAFGDPRGV